MTLKEWSKLTGILPTTPTTERGAVSVVCDSLSCHKINWLWRLSDYVVSSVGGGVIWLVPKQVVVMVGDPNQCIYGFLNPWMN